MRGGAQAHLVEATDGGFYVVKFRNNPQHRRVLANEWIAGEFLDYLQLHTAKTAIIEIDQAFLESNPEVCLQYGGTRHEVEPGWHFGSRTPGDPLKTAIYDFLPDLLLGKTANLAEYAGALVFDQWMGNADSRQTIFYRAQVSETGYGRPPRNAFVAMMVDHGFVFGGPDWTFQDAPLRGLYHRPLVYHGIKGWGDFEPWLERVRHFPEEIIDRAIRSLPPAWLADDGEALNALLEKLMRRRARVADLIEAVRDSQSRPFPQWRG